MFASLVTLGLGIVKAFGIADTYLQALVALYLKDKCEKIDSTSITREQKVALAMKNLTEAKTDEEAALYFSILNDVKRGVQHT